MTWREQLQSGSFRGVPFLTDSIDNALGRRAVLHEYPLRDKPYAEDMGRKARQFTLDGYVLGDDYMRERDALIDALEKPGTGTLIHPYWGSVNVQVLTVSVRESSADGRMASFSVTFAESGENDTPAQSVSTASQIDDSVSLAKVAAVADFARRFSVAGLPAFLTGEITTVLNTALDAIGVDPAALSLVKSIKNNIVSMISDPSQLGAGIIDALAQIIDIKTLRQLQQFGSDLPVISETTPSRILQAGNQQSLVDVVRTASVLQTARQLASNLVLDNKQQAVDFRNDLTDQIDTLMETAADDSYYAMTQVRTAVVNDINFQVANKLSAVMQHRPLNTLPALVVAHQIYYDGHREADIVQRNRQRHPGFLAGGTDVEYLTESA